MKKKYKEFVVYKITNVNSKKAYIGITCNYKRRMRSHLDYYKYENKKSYLNKAISKYGKNAFIHKIIDTCNSWKELCQREIFYIGYYDTKAPNGYNLTAGGEGTLNPPDETRKKMSDSHIGNKRSIESCKKQSESVMGNNNHYYGKKHTFEIRKKISNAIQGKMIGEKNGFYGKKHTSEMCQNMAKLKRQFSNEQVIEIKKMLIKGIYQKIIAKKFNVNQDTISQIKIGKRYSDIQVSGIDLNNLPKGNRKFNKDQVLEIRKMLCDKISQKIIAKKFGVNKDVISMINTNKRYAEIQLSEQEKNNGI